MEQYPLPDKDYMVLIRCFTYNHEAYIEDALKGFVMQKTNFPFVAVVVDDASTDRTADIIRKYEKEYPDIIKGVYLKENHYSQKKKKAPYVQPWRDRCKYEAICEGDDYWIDPLKLQKQVDFLEKNTQYSAVFSNTLIRDERQIPVKESLTQMHKREYGLFEVLSGTMFGLQNICVRKEVFFDTSIQYVKANGDLKTYYLCALYGKIYRLDGTFAVYRQTGKGVASSRKKNEQLIAEIKERYEFHQQLNFPMPKALIYSQVKAILSYLKHNAYKDLPFSELKKYTLKNKLEHLLYFIYSVFIITAKKSVKRFK